MTQCKNCKTETTVETPACSVCNYPIQGTENAQASFIAKQVMQKREVGDSIERLKKSRIILFAIGAFHIIVPFTPLMNSSSIALIFSLVLGLVFVGFGFHTFKKPLIAVGIPLGLTVLYYLMLLVINPMYLLTGILWKIIILIGLGYGFFSVRKSNSILKENKYLASVLGFAEVKNK